MRKATFGDAQRRGVFVAPWTGENGEIILVAVTCDRRRIAERLVPFGAAAHAIADELWDLLEAADPDRRASMRVI
jgi:hypothetical protein